MTKKNIYESELEKIMLGQKYVDAYKRTLDSISGYSAFQKAMESMSGVGAYQKMISSATRLDQLTRVTRPLGMEAFQRQFPDYNNVELMRKSLASLGDVSKYQKALSSMGGIDRFLKATETLDSLGIYKKVTASLGGAGLQKSIDSFDAYKRTLASMGSIDRLRKAMESISSVNNYQSILSTIEKPNYLQKAIAALSQPTTLHAAVEALGRSVDLQDQAIIQAEMEALTEAEINDNLALIDAASDQFSFLQIFSKLPPAIQTILLFIFLQVFVPQVNSIFANLITPYVEEVLFENDGTEREKINAVKNLPLTSQGIETENIRFITGDIVRIRSAPNTSAEIIDELSLGQVVTVIEKKRNWIKVGYQYEDGEVVQGWVFTRYTAKFKK